MSDEIRRKAEDAFEEAIVGHVVGLPTWTASAGPLIGSGVGIQHDGYKFIVTAAHHAKFLNPDQIDIFVRPPGLLQHRSLLADSGELGYSLKHRVKILDQYVDHLLDFAILVLSDDQILPDRLSFIGLESTSEVPAPGETAVVFGFPSALSRLVVADTLGASLARSIGQVLPDMLSQKANPSTQFEISYNLMREDDQQLIRAHGFSGSGIWAEGQVEDVIWTADPKLFGIVTHVVNGDRLLGLRIEPVERAIRGYVLDRTKLSI